MSPAPPDTDQRLMRSFQHGDVAAFETLVRKFQGPVLALCRRTLGSRSPGVDDVAQEVFLRIYRHRATYEPTAKVSTWIYRVTVNACLNEIRRLKADKNRRVAGFTAVFGDGERDGDAAPGSLLADASAPSPSDGAEEHEAAERVRRAIDALPEQQRLAVVLSRYHGLAYEDVAAAMDTTMPAVKSVLMRARENLAKALGAYVRSEPSSVPARLVPARPIASPHPPVGAIAADPRPSAVRPPRSPRHDPA